MQFYLISQFSLAETITASMPATAVAGRMMFSESWHRLRNERHYNVLQMFCKNTLTTWLTSEQNIVILFHFWIGDIHLLKFVASWHRRPYLNPCTLPFLLNCFNYPFIHVHVVFLDRPDINWLVVFLETLYNICCIIATAKWGLHGFIYCLLL